MATAIKIVSDLKVGDGWRYRCLTCSFEVGIDKAFPETCPGCGARGWWGRLTASDIGKLAQKNRDGDDIKNPNETMSGGINTPKRILSQQENAVVHGLAQNNGVFEPSQGRGRGRPRHDIPESLILELGKKGFSSRAMVGELSKRGLKVSYKTVQRRLQGALL